MIADRDRSGWIGASDTEYVIGRRRTATFEKWWLEKLAVRRERFYNQYTLAGTYFEHRILESLGLGMELDRQIMLPELRLRVNLDGSTADCIYECKTHRADKPFKAPQKYINQVQVQLYAAGVRRAELVAYGLEEADYTNFFRPIDPERLQRFPVEYDAEWINTVYLPKLRELAEYLKKGVWAE